MQSAQNRVVVAHRVANSDGPLLGNILTTLVGSDVDKGLAAQPDNRQHRHNRDGRRCPHHPRLDLLQVTQLAQIRVDRSLGQDSLQAVVHLRRNEVDGSVLQQILLVVENDHRQTLCGSA